jgi:hypothetical protein
MLTYINYSITGSSNKIQCGTRGIENSPLIAYGEDTYPGQWPWHAALYLYKQSDFTFICGGSFVGTRSVITGNWLYNTPLKHEKN